MLLRSSFNFLINSFKTNLSLSVTNNFIFRIILMIQAFCTRDYREFIINESSEEGLTQPFDEDVTDKVR